MRLELPSDAEIGTLVLTGERGGSPVTATEQSDATITGHAVGVRVGRDVILTFPGGMWDQEPGVSYAYDPLATVTESLTPTAVGADVQVTTSDPFRPGSLRLEIPIKRAAQRRQAQAELVVAS